ncbi:hypothetical protein ACQ4PT_069424 [Festuca glaucescens]
MPALRPRTAQLEPASRPHPRESVAEEILLKLRTRDAVRCRCVSRQWRALLTDPFFINLHVHSAHIVAGCGAEALVVTEIRSRRIGLEMAVLDNSSGKPMCRVTDLASCYRPTNACNGFLVAADMKDSPVYVCNPVTGEKQNILPPPESEDVYLKLGLGSLLSIG